MPIVGTLIHLAFLPDDQVPVSFCRLFPVILSFCPCKFEQLDASRANGVRPVIWVLCVRYASRDLVEKIGGRYRAMKRGYKVRWEEFKCLDKGVGRIATDEGSAYTYPREEEDLVRQPLILHLVCVG